MSSKDLKSTHCRGKVNGLNVLFLCNKGKINREMTDWAETYTTAKTFKLRYQQVKEGESIQEN